jgi:threonine/homoserine/homoserine lactone efflux protein
VAKQLRRHRKHQAAPDPAEHTHLTIQLSFAARRAHLLQQAMTALHITLGIFIASIFSIGLFELVNSSAAWIIAVLSVLGATLLLYASLLLIRESRLAVADVAEETAYLTRAE